MLVFLICSGCDEQIAPETMMLMSLNQQSAKNGCDSDPCQRYEKICQNTSEQLSDNQQKKCSNLREQCTICKESKKLKEPILQYCSEDPLCVDYKIGIDGDGIGPECECPDAIELLLTTRLPDDLRIEVINPKTQKVVATRTNNGSSFDNSVLSDLASEGVNINLHNTTTGVDYPVIYNSWQ